MVRTGHASASMLDTISVEVYGQRNQINQLGTVNDHMVTINVWDKTNVSNRKSNKRVV